MLEAIIYFPFKLYYCFLNNPLLSLPVEGWLFIKGTIMHHYPLVIQHSTLENHHLQWENPLFLWSFSIAGCQSLPEGISHKIPLNHHFPIVFLWFSYGLPEGNSSLPVSWCWDLAPAVQWELQQRLCSSQCGPTETTRGRAASGRGGTILENPIVTSR